MREETEDHGIPEGYKVLAHDRGHECPSCHEKDYCNDCQVCTSCGFSPLSEAKQ